MLKLTKSKYFWIVWVIISFIGGGIGYYIIVKKDKLLANAEIKYCYEYRDRIKRASIITIPNRNQEEEYLKYFLSNGEITTLNFNFLVLNEGQKVKVIDSVQNGKLIKIAVENQIITLASPAYQELWIWHAFLFKLPQ